MEHGLLNTMHVKPCTVYSFQEIVTQEKANCGYKFTDGTFVQPVQWVTRDKDTGKFLSHKGECSKVVSKLLGGFRGGKLTDAEKRKMRTEGNLDKRIQRALSQLVKQNSEKRI